MSTATGLVSAAMVEQWLSSWTYCNGTHDDVGGTGFRPAAELTGLDWGANSWSTSVSICRSAIAVLAVAGA